VNPGRPSKIEERPGRRPDKDGRMREIACDESGYEGERLIGSTTRLFAHASVCVPDAAAILTELRARIKSPATQYKAGHLLREKHRPVLRWFLGPDGPVIGRGHVFLLDKAEFVRSTFEATLGRTIPDDQLWLANELLRGRTTALPQDFPAEEIAAFQEWLRADPIARSVLDPLVPAIVAAVDHWGPVSIAHDRQIRLPPRRIDALRERCPLRAIRFLDAESHPEIQIADILAGTVRRLTEVESEAEDDQLKGLLPPFVGA
jgi:hypothetical protein